MAVFWCSDDIRAQLCLLLLLLYYTFIIHFEVCANECFEKAYRASPLTLNPCNRVFYSLSSGHPKGSTLALLGTRECGTIGHCNLFGVSSRSRVSGADTCSSEKTRFYRWSRKKATNTFVIFFCCGLIVVCRFVCKIQGVGQMLEPALRRPLLLVAVAITVLGAWRYSGGEPMSLPGDIRYESGGLSVHFPWVSCIFLSVFGNILMRALHGGGARGRRTAW